MRSCFGRQCRWFSAVRQMSDGQLQSSDSVAVAKSYAYTSQHTPNVRQSFMFHYSGVVVIAAAGHPCGAKCYFLWFSVVVCGFTAA